MAKRSDYSKVTTEMLDHDEMTVDENEVIITSFYGGKLEKYSKDADLRAWYMEYRDLFVNNKKIRMLDIMGPKSDRKVGKFFDHQELLGQHVDNDRYLNRTGDMFETKFYWNEYDPGVIDFEVMWEARVPMDSAYKYGNTGHGWAEFKVDLVNRFMSEKEVLVGSEKKTFYGGAWEFRNRFTYKNAIIPNVLNKIPIIKNNARIKAQIVNYFYRKHIERDLDLVESDFGPMLKAPIVKYFT